MSSPAQPGARQKVSPATSAPVVPPPLDEEPRSRYHPETDDGPDDPSPAEAERRAADAQAHDYSGACPAG